MSSVRSGFRSSRSSRVNPMSREYRARGARSRSPLARDYLSPSPPRHRRRRAANAANAASPSSSPEPRFQTAGILRHMDQDIGYRRPEIPIYGGAEGEPIDLREQKKIQIDIRRNIPGRPGNRISEDESIIRRNLVNPLKMSIPRRNDEGVKPIFHRDEIKFWKEDSAVVSKSPKVIALVDRPIEKYERRMRESPPPPIRSSSSSFKRDIRSRLGNSHKSRSHVLDRLGSRREDAPLPRSGRSHMDRESESVKSRLGDRRGSGEQRTLARDEMEKQRPKVSLRDVNPEFVPRGFNYFEHDNREGESDSRISTSSARRGRGDLYRRGGFNRRFNGRGDNFRWKNNNKFSKFRGRNNASLDGEWKHDKFFDEDMES